MKISDKLEKAREYEQTERKKVEKSTKPLFHMSNPIGWMNDPNGFSYYKGEYHLFFQYYPYGTFWGPMHWGHCTTKDFVKWEYKPCALAPDEAYDAAGCFSGTALEWEGRHVLMYTSVREELNENGEKQVRQTQSIAFGDGNNYIKYEKNPVITTEELPEGSSKVDFRDPKLWKDENGFWALVGSKGKDGSGQLALYHSDNLTKWNFIKILDACHNEYGKMWECPDFFPLDGKQVLVVSPQFMMSDGKEFHNGNNSVYFLGKYKSKEQIWERAAKAHTLDHGLDFYAPQTTCSIDGRRIMIGWLQSWDNYLTPEDYRWSGTMTIPRELKIINDKLIQNPVRELNSYRKGDVFYKNILLTAESTNTQLDHICGRCIDMTVILRQAECKKMCIWIAGNDLYRTAILYEKQKGCLTIDRTYSGLRKDMLTTRSLILEPSDHEELKLRVLLDKNNVEIYVNDGKYVMSMLLYTPLSAEKIWFETDGNVRMDIEKYDIAID